MKKLLRFITPYRFITTLGLTCKLIESIFELFLPLIMAKLIDAGLTLGTEFVVKNIALMAGIIFVCYALAFCCQRSAAYVGANFGTDIRRDLYKNINTLSYGELDTLDGNTLLTALTNDLSNVQLSVSIFIRLATRAPFITIGSLIMAFTISKPISFIFLAIVPIVSFILIILMKKSIVWHKKTLKSLDKITKSTRENLDGVRVVRAYNKQSGEIEEFEVKNKEYYTNSLKMNKLLSLSSPLTSLIVNVCCAIIVYVGGQFVNFGSLQAGEVTALTTYLFQILLALTVLSNLGVTFTKAESSATRINSILDTKTSIFDKEDAISTIDNVTPTIEFKDVSFRYNNTNTDAISEVNLKINQSEWVGVIGITGSSKTTLANLIPRFYDVTKGSVLIDGINVKDFSLKALRKYVAIVPQRASAFRMSIFDNIKFGSDATQSDVEKASTIAQCDEFILNKTHGFDSIVSEDGKNLSGGQRQRLSIARAVARNPKILILDDSMSALDNITERKLAKALKQNLSKTTMIIISQRVSSLKFCDKIAVMSGGALVAYGTHDELISTSDEYKTIYESQTMGESI